MSERTVADTILIEELEFYGFHGVPDAEQAVGHRYRVDVRMIVDTRAAIASDAVSDTVNYAEVAQILVDMGTQTQFHLLETLADQMAQAIFEHFVQVQMIKLGVRKLLPPMNAIVGAVGVEITRRRTEE